MNVKFTLPKIFLKKVLFLFLLLFNSCLCCFAQYFPSKVYPRNYFGNPLNIPLQLSANFGELRKEHFHMGLDIRTNQKENLPVFAAADGYISKIRIEPFGYGRAIYIQHPNGYTTLYAHLNNFFDSLECFVKQKQYDDEQWEQNFELEPNKFKVTKGQFIAFSGNTGGSQGPHLHFEIRDENGNNLNPLLFSFNIEDTKKPIIDYLYLYDRTRSSYLNKPTQIALKKIKNETIVKDSLITVYNNKISFGIWAEDITNASNYRFGIYQAEVWMDSTLQFAFRLNNFSYNDSRYINACFDYPTKYTTGKYIQHLSKLPGNHLNIFSENTGDGVIELNDTIKRDIEIVIKDVAGNSNSLQFKIQKKDSLLNKTITNNIDTLLAPNKEANFSKNGVAFSFNKSAFYDTLPLMVTNFYNEYSCNASLPIHNNYIVSIPVKYSVVDTLKNKYVIQLSNNTYSQTEIASWKDNVASAGFNRFGTVKVLIDTIAPIINTVGWSNNFIFNNQSQLSFHVKDNLTSIKSFRAELNGKWLLFSRKNNFYTYTFDEYISLGMHSLTVMATDDVGNITQKTFSFIKEAPVANKSKQKLLTKKKKTTKKKSKKRK